MKEYTLVDLSKNLKISLADKLVYYNLFLLADIYYPKTSVAEPGWGTKGALSPCLVKK